MLQMSFDLGFMPHFRDFDIVITPNSHDSNRQTKEVNGGHGVFEHLSGSYDCDDFLEDSSDGEGDDGGALEECELRSRHAEGDEAGEKED